MYWSILLFILSLNWTLLRCIDHQSLIQILQRANDQLRSSNVELRDQVSYLETELNKAEIRYGRLDQEMKTRESWMEDVQVRRVNRDLKSKIAQQTKEIVNLKNTLERKEFDRLKQEQHFNGQIQHFAKVLRELHDDKLKLLTWASTLRKDDEPQVPIPDLSLPAQPLQPVPVLDAPKATPVIGVPLEIPSPPHYVPTDPAQTSNWVQTHEGISMGQYLQ